MQWTPNGDSFKILSVPQLEATLLPAYFRHNKFPSLVRQLNFYNFRKTNKERSFAIYHHPLFHRNREEDLIHLRRKTCLGVDGRSSEALALKRNPRGTTTPLVTPSIKRSSSAASFDSYSSAPLLQRQNSDGRRSVSPMPSASAVGRRGSSRESAGNSYSKSYLTSSTSRRNGEKGEYSNLVSGTKRSSSAFEDYPSQDKSEIRRLEGVVNSVANRLNEYKKMRTCPDTGSENSLGIVDNTFRFIGEESESESESERENEKSDSESEGGFMSQVVLGSDGAVDYADDEFFGQRNVKGVNIRANATDNFVNDNGGRDSSLSVALVMEEGSESGEDGNFQEGNDNIKDNCDKDNRNSLTPLRIKTSLPTPHSATVTPHNATNTPASPHYSSLTCQTPVTDETMMTNIASKIRCFTPRSSAVSETNDDVDALPAGAALAEIVLKTPPTDIMGEDKVSS